MTAQIIYGTDFKAKAEKEREKENASMKITYERIDFAKGTVTEVEREIDSRQVLAGNALFQRLARKTAPSHFVADEKDGA